MPRTCSIQAGLGEARAEIERAATVLKKRREALQSLEGAVMGRIPTLRRMAEDAYREGSADILELLDANRSLRDFQLTRVQQLEAVKLAEETVIGAAGLGCARAGSLNASDAEILRNAHDRTRQSSC